MYGIMVAVKHGARGLRSKDKRLGWTLTWINDAAAAHFGHSMSLMRGSCFLAMRCRDGKVA